MPRRIKNIALSFLTILCGFVSFAQSKRLSGKVIDQDLLPVPHAVILLSDSSRAGITDVRGNFNIQVPEAETKITVAFTGAIPQILVFQDNCNYFEVILQYGSCHSGKSLRQVHRIQKKESRKLPYLHKLAFKKKIFNFAAPCYQL